MSPDTELDCFHPNQVPGLRNPEEMSEQIKRELKRRIRYRLRVDGAAFTLVILDGDGLVKQVAPQTGHETLDESVVTLWKRARFAPTASSGCRVPVLMQLPLDFATDPGRRSIRAGTRRPC